jgi:hypothetical protein
MRINNLILMVLLTISITSNAQTLKGEWIVCNTQGCKLLDPYYSEGVTFKWEGSCVNGKANGYGKATKYKNGQYESTYEGDYKNGIREGKGKYTHIQGTIQEGIFVKGQMTGLGTEIFSNGDIYKGEFINYCMHGKGSYYQPSGDKFEGFFINGYYTGKYTYSDGKVAFIEKGQPVSSINEKTSSYKPEIGIKVTEYFDENWNRCKQKEAAYYRLYFKRVK